MKYLILPILMLLMNPAHADYSLIWSDEFDGTNLDLDRWSYDIGDGCPDLCGWGNAELQYYRAENVDVADGRLTITARQQWFEGCQFTSGKITTRDLHDFLYGRMEMRAKLPTGGGMWPAFWMMPQDDAYGGWAASGEIDIMEAANVPIQINGTIHYGGPWPENVYSHGSYAPAGVDFSEDFHTYAVEWDPDEIRWYVDDIHYFTRTSDQWYSTGAPGNPLAPFDQPFYLILNLAVGGHYTGCTDPGCIDADLPQEYVVDYVRVYTATDNQAPYAGSPMTLPGVVEAEDFDLGGQTIAYLDTDAGNTGGAYRPDEDVDVQACSDTGGGYNVGWLRAGEWLEYTIDATMAGEYPVEVRVASASVGGSFRLEFDGVDRTGEVTVPVTGGWQNWATVSTTVDLPAGTQVLRFVPVVEGFNLNHLAFGEPAAVAAPVPSAHVLLGARPNPFNPVTTITYHLSQQATVTLRVFDAAGRLVRTLEDGAWRAEGRHEVSWRGVDDRGRGVASGTYYCRLEAGGWSDVRALTVVR